MPPSVSSSEPSLAQARAQASVSGAAAAVASPPTADTKPSQRATCSASSAACGSSAGSAPAGGGRAGPRRVCQRHDGVPVLPAVVRELVARQGPLGPACVERMVQDVPALAHRVQLFEELHGLARPPDRQPKDRRRDATLPPVRTPAGKIAAPMFPDGTSWLNVAMLRMDKQHGRPVLLEFFDVCRVSSLRTLPYVKAWAAKYPDLRVISVHSPGYPPSHDEGVVRAAVERLEIEHAVALDERMAIWQLYGNEGWPGRYLWDKELRLFELHYGEGAYRETEEAIQE